MADIFKQVIQIAVDVLGVENAGKLEEALKGLGDAGATADDKLSPLVDELTKLGTTSLKVQEALDLSKRIEANNVALVAAKKVLADLNKEFDKTDKSSADINVAFQQAEKSVKGLAAEQLKLQTAFATSVTTLKAAGVNTNDLGAANEQLKKETAGVADQLTAQANASTKAAAGAKEAAAGTKQLGDEAQRSSGLLTLVADNLGKIVTLAAATRLALAGIHFSADAFKGASAVEDQLARVQATAQATQEAFQKFGPAISAAAEEVNVSTDQAAKALAALAAQGQSADEALLSLVPTLRLAKIAQIDVSQAAGILDDALDRFGLTAADAGAVVDILVESSKGAKDGLVGIATAMQQIAPLARDAGLSFKDTAAILGDLQQNGFDAGNAVRGLRTIFEDLSDPASKLRADLSELGDDSGNFATAIDTIAGAGDRGKQALQNLTGSARVVATFLAQQGAGAIQKFTDNLDKAAGSASRVVDAINKTAGGAFDALTNSIDRAAQELAKPFLEPVAAELTKLAAEISAFAKSSDFDEIRKDLTALARDAVEALDKLIHGLKWEDLRDNAKGAVAGLKDDFHSLAQDADAVVTAISRIVAAVTAFKNLGDIGVDIGQTIFGSTSAAAVGAALAVSKAKDSITGSVSDTTRALQTLFDALAHTAGSGIGGLIDDSAEGAAAIRKLGNAADEVGPKFRNVQSSIATTAVSFKNVDAGARSTAPSLQQMGKVATLANEDIKGLDVALAHLGKTQVQLAQDASNAERDLNAVFQGFTAGRVSIEDVQASFDKYAAALRASVANSEDWKKQVVEDTLRVKAAALGIPEAFDEIGSHKLQAPDTGPIRNALQEVQQASSAAAQALEQDQQHAVESAAHISEALGNALSADAAFFSEFAAVSANAVKRFSDATKEFFFGAHIFSQAAITDGTGIIKFGESVAAAGKLVEDEIAQQRQGVAELSQQYSDMSDAAIEAAAKQRGGFGALQADLEGTAAAARAGSSAFDLLGAADLSSLSSALDAAAQKVDALRQKAEQATEALKSIGDQLADEIDQILGNQDDIEQRRFENQIQQIKDEAALAGNLNSAQVAELIRQATLLHELKMKQIRDEQAAQGKAPDAPDGGDNPNKPPPPPEPPKPPPQQPPPAPPPAQAPPPTQAPRGLASIVINVVLLSGDEKARAEFARFVKQTLDDLNDRS